MNKGATWGKWDLHIHTPASYEWRGGRRFRDIPSGDERQALLREVIEGINASGCVAVALMDYWTFDGIIALREYLNQPDAVACKAAIFPGMELRMVSPGDFRLNMHVLLNPVLSIEKLQAFKAQIKLSITGKPLTDEYLIEFAREHISEQRLIDLGTSKAAVLANSASALEAASKTVEVTPESVIAALKLFGKSDAILFIPFDTNDGVKKIRFREHHAFPNELLAMEAIFEVSNPGTRDAFIGLQTEANKSYFNEFQEAIKLPKLAVRGSDAHAISDYGNFPNGRITWIKASATFEGLLQACKEPANRSYVGTLPPKVDFVARNPHLFLGSVQIRKRANAPELGTWFDGTDLPLNEDLVALIGRKGSGKSALADVLGLLGDTPNGRHFSFLSEHRFRLPKDNKASSFEARLQWKQNTKAPEWRLLSASRPPSAVQRIKYLPQRYFEELCNDHVQGDDQLLQDELREVIFSHIPYDERDDSHSLDELINRRSEEIEREIADYRSRLKTLNSRIITLSNDIAPDAQKALRESVRLAIVRLKALRQNRPDVTEAPKNTDDGTRLAAERIEALNAEIFTLEEQSRAAETQLDTLKGSLRTIDEVTNQLNRLEKNIGTEKELLAPKLVSLQLDVDDVIKFTIERGKVESLRSDTESRLAELRTAFDPANEGSISSKLGLKRQEKAEEQSKMDEPMRRYQEALTRSEAWQNEWTNAVGTRERTDSFVGLWSQMRAMSDRRSELAQLVERRLSLAVDILNCLKRRADLLRALFAPVQALIDEEPQIRDALGVRFSVRFSFDAFAVRLFDYIKQSVGSFVGAEESKSLAQTLLVSYDLETDDGLRAFLSAVHAKLVTTGGGKPVALASLLKSGRTINEILDFLYGIPYAELSYGLKLGNVELERLSPGQRGALLLIFYLLVDRERIPIVLDQPEENLDNETVYQLLVGVITRAKQHRQVIMVTHNANLAIACDAEQVIVCSMDRDGSNRIKYVSGGIEDLELNRAAIDILEGTKPAFENRRRKYQ
ncbi:MAG: ABC transporter [Pseudomonadota bacterium]